MSQIVLPGDFLFTLREGSLGEDGQVKILGPGLENRKDGVYATKPGILQRNGNKTWVDSFEKRYTPRAGDRVLGVVTGRAGENYKVDIGCADQALLNFFAFEGATKKNKPVVKTGDLIYGQVVLTAKQFEPELSCVDNQGNALGMGIIKTPGTQVPVSLWQARQMLRPDDTLLTALGKELKFEAIVGMNGRVWISGEPAVVLAVREAVLAAEKAFHSNYPLIVDQAVVKARSMQAPK
ncbi:exosome complex component RRP40 protein-like protein [Aphelenchoides avenae]|nr:exosome complex component RRP40 protein-like protein [Aphelenchus avenae]